MASRPIHAITATGTVGVGPLLAEAIALAGEARDYIRVAEAFQMQGPGADASLAFALESSRLATRIGECVAWLMARRAVHVGDLAPDEALAPSWRLQHAALCLDREGEQGPVPERLRNLLARSAALYLRIARLDSRLGRAAAG